MEIRCVYTEGNQNVIQEAVDRLPASGGTVIVPRGEWKSGAIHLKSNVKLYLEEGCVIHFSSCMEDYLPPVFTRWEGVECYNYSSLIYAADCENVTICGTGVLDGAGSAWWHWKNLINYKYHDLKHQIAVLRSETDPEKRNEFLNHMEDEIRQYEAQNKTGNKVLDTVLTSKSLYCAKHGITFTCVADGTLLDFMDIMDICSIFGNALDNAIECELKIADKEKRLIHVTVSQQKKFLILRFENYYEGSLKVKEGRFLTTKKEKEFHGYGIKSIRYTVNKYDGAVSIDTKENWFDLKILIPMKKTASDEVQNG